MALCSLRLRRAVTLSSYFLNHHRPLSSIPSFSSPPSLSSSITPNPASLERNQPRHLGLPYQFQSRLFKLSEASLSTRGRSFDKDFDDQTIGPDTILFEGCDYNHWLIVMDFPKDNKPPPEEMVETYVQTCAKVVGSVEEAKKKIYACSTTTYTGFQVEVPEETANKFEGLPGVIFVLPDSYIDPVNKEYGGDKYINGTIIPRPPPIQYGRPRGRYGDRNREFSRPNQPRGQYQQGNPAYDNRGPVQGDGRNFGAQQNPPLNQNYAAPGAGERRDSMPMNNAFPRGQDNYQGDRRGQVPPNEAVYNQGQQGHYYSQEPRAFAPGVQSNYSPHQQRDFRRDNVNYAPPQGGSYGQGLGVTSGQGMGSLNGPDYTRHQDNQRFSQVEQRSNIQGEQRSHQQSDFRGDNVNYAPPQGGSYGQGSGGTSGQGMGSFNTRDYMRHQENQRFSQVEQRSNIQGEQRSHPAMEPCGTDQGRY